MENSKCEKIMWDSKTGNIPMPPKEIETLLDEYQDFLGSVFERNHKYDNYDFMPIHVPKLTNEEQTYIETLTRKLQASKGWKYYIKRCSQWAFTM